MTQQEHIERSLRMLIGELQVQVLVANARIAELQEEAAERDLDKQPEPDPIPKTNGKSKDGDPGTRP
jgi:hypothetical protein